MQNYYSDKSFTKHLAKPPHEDQAAALQHYLKIFVHSLSWEDLRWIRAQTKLPIAVKGIQCESASNIDPTLIQVQAADASAKFMNFCVSGRRPSVTPHRSQ
jgi:isopentenyl diphosphate isomerase/L-lactate dehydrogenase-like FMN-dependent dehydrogenase